MLYYSAESIKPSVVATLLFHETSIAGTIHRLEDRGWVERSPDPHDNRAVGLALSESGRVVAQQIAQIMGDLYDELFGAALGASERRQVEADLRKVRALGFKLPETGTSSSAARSNSRSGRANASGAP